CQPSSLQSTFSLISGLRPPINAVMAKAPEPPSLGDLRREIDRIDEAMHQLLIERGTIIDRLIEAKRSQDTGASAFRPAREAEMMRRLVNRHKGILPLDTVESIWRVIISTFTYVQAPFSVHADLSAGDALMRDSARFHFGFTVPFVPHMGAAAVVAAVSASKGDLGLVPAFDISSAGAWWGGGLSSRRLRRSAAACPSLNGAITRLPCLCSCSPVSQLTPWRRKPPCGACASRAGASAPQKHCPRSLISLPCRTGPSTAPLCL